MLRGLNPSSVYFEDWNGVMRPLKVEEVEVNYNVEVEALQNALLEYKQQASITIQSADIDWDAIMKVGRLDPPPEVLKPSLKRQFKEIRIGRQFYK